MSGVMHLQYSTGFMTSERSRASKQRKPPSGIALIPTWVLGYDRAAQMAREAAEQGNSPVLLKLASQESPASDLLRKFHEDQWPLLSVSNRFGREGCSRNELVEAVNKAAAQWRAGWPEPAQRRPSQQAPASQDSTTTRSDLTEDERREFLRAVYGRAGDDGVR